MPNAKHLRNTKDTNIEKWLDIKGAEQMKECCGTCKYNKRDFSKPQDKGYIEFCCGNENSDYYGVPTFYDDDCDDWEEKD